MFFILSKLLEFVLSPILWIVLFLLLGLFRKSESRKWLMSAVALLLIGSNPFISNRVLHLWEVPSYPASSIPTPYEVGILLGGSINFYDEQLKRPVYSQGVDRLMQTMHLYKTGKIKKILISGGSGLVLNRGFSEAEVTRQLFIEAGIPDEHILTEGLSRNTHENAAETTKMLRKLNITSTPLLITSAFHMRRSLACFHKAGLDVVPFPVDRKSALPSYTPDRIIIPDPVSLATWKAMFKEWVGLLAYKMQGYV